MKRKGKYLFFDIECCNGYNICSFGYALISEDLRVIAKKDIIINPENKFILSPKGKRPKMELAYPEEMFFKQDNFSAFYPEIRRLLSQEGYVLIGHSIQSDFHFLRYACERYGLATFDIEGYDTQKIFHHAYNTEHAESLEKIMAHLDIDTQKITFHRSCDDALATFYVARAICKEQDVSLDQLLQRHSDCKVSTRQIFHNRDEKPLKQKKFRARAN